MNISSLIDTIKNHPDYEKAGMILCHNGVVRRTSRDGREIKGLEMHIDYNRLQQVLEKQKKRPGIVEIIVEFPKEKKLSIGDDLMLLVVAGDVRDNVIAVLSDTLNELKKTVTHKTEFFV